MNHFNVLLSIVELAETGRPLRLEDAIARIAAFVCRLSPMSDSYESDMKSLTEVGATISAMTNQLS